MFPDHLGQNGMKTGTPLRILVVEDEAPIAMEIEDQLKELGYHPVGPASSLAKALEIAGRERPDLVLMDIHLGEGDDGVDTAARLRAQYELRVIYLTAFSDEGTLTRAKPTKPLGYLVKPFTGRTLRAAIEVAINVLESDRELERQTARLEELVAERTAALASANARLEAELEERRRAEVVVRDREQHLQDFFDNASDLIQSVGVDGRILFTNVAWRATLGYSEADTARLNIFDLVAPSCREHCGELFARLMQGEDGGLIEMALVTKDGRLAHLEGNVSVRREQGVPVSTRGIFRDVTQRRESESRLRLFRALLERVGDAVEVIDPATGRFLDVNERGCSELGYSREELLSLSVPDVDPMLDASAFARNAATVRASGSATFESVRRRKDGTAFPVEVNFSHVPLDRDYTVAVVRNIAERKRIEAALRESEENLAITLRSIGDAVLVTDSRRCVTRMNPVAEQLTGWPEAEALGRPVDEIFRILDEETREPAVIPVDEVLATGKIHAPAHSTALVARDGHEISIADSAAPIRNRAGQLVGVVLVFRDVTGEKRAQRLLREHEEDLSAVIESSPEAIGVVNTRTGLIEKANRQTEAMFGLNRADLERTDPVRLSPEFQPDGRRSADGVKERLDAALRGELPVFEWIHLGARGRLIPCEVRLMALPAPREHLIRFSVTDITDRKQAEARLRERESLLSSINANLIGSAICRLRLTPGGQMGCTYVSPNIGLMLGLDPVEFQERPEMLFERIHPEDLPALRIANRRAWQTGDDTAVDFRICRPDNTHRWLHYRGCLVERLPDGTQIRDGIGTDITALKEAEAEVQRVNGNLERLVEERSRELAASERHFRQLFENSPLGIYQTTPDGRILLANPALLRMLGYDSFEALGRRNLEQDGFTESDSRDEFKAAMERDGAVLGRESVWSRADGSSVFVRENAQALRDDSGRIVAYEGVVEDITERKRAEEALKLAHHRTFVLAHLGRELAEAATPRAAAISILEATDQMFGWDSGWIQFWNEDRQEFENPVIFDLVDGGRREVPSDSASLRAPGPGVRRAMRDGAFLHLRSDESDGIEGETPFGSLRRSLSRMFVAIRRDGRLLGILSIQSYRRNAYDAAALELLQTLGDHCAGALDRIQVRTALDVTEARYRRVVDNIGDALVMDDVAGRVIYANRQFLDLFGLAEGDLESLRLEDYVAPEYRAELRDRHDRRMAGEPVPEHFEYEGLGRDGVRRWLEARVTKVMENGVAVGTQSAVRDISERRRAEAALRSSEEQLNQAQSVAHTGSWHLDGRQGRLSWSAETYRIFAVPEGTPVDHAAFIARVHPEDRERVDQAWQAALGGAAYDIEHRIMQGGEVRWVRERARLQFEADGRLREGVGTVQDITELKRAEAELRTSRERLGAIVAATPSCIKLLDADGNLVEMNREGLDLIEADDLGEVKGRCVYDLIAPDFRDAFRQFNEQVCAGHGGSLEFRIEGMRGTPRWMHTSAAPMRDPATGRTLHLAVTQDVSERKRAEEELRQSEQNYREIFNSVNDAVFIHDAETGAILDANESMLRLFGLTLEEARRSFPQDTSLGESPYSAAEAADWMRKTVEEGPQVFEWHARKKDGQLFWVEVSLRCATINGRSRLLAVVRDITERVQQERLLQRSQRLESIGTLAGGIAHDLNNSLAPIMMGMKMLQLEYPKETELLKMFESSARRAVEMVRQLLNFARGAEGERNLLEPSRLVVELENLMRGSFPKNLELVIRCEPRLPLVLGDATQLHQVLLNLCVNARDAMPGGGTLTLEATRREVDAALVRSQPDARPGEYVMLRVTDTGVGIPAEILDRIFEPFFTTKGPEKGTGLGLSTVAGIVKGHGGFMVVESQPGHGSTFSIHLPVERAGTASGPATQPVAAFRGQGETVLLVDDEPNVRKMGHVVLQGLNLRPLTANDGVDGLIQAERNRGALRAIITDMHMPGMDGLAFVRALRRTLPDIPVVVASGRLDESVAAEFRALGVTARLDKPFTELQLSEVLQGVLARR